MNQEMIKVFGAEKAKCLKTGEEYLVEKQVGEKLIKKGEATAIKKAAKAE